MEREEIIKRLNGLIQLDVDAVEAYGQVIKRIEYDDIRRRLTEFQDDHKAHIQNLSSVVQQLDGRPVKATPDLKGYFLEFFTALMAIAGSMGAMEAMKANEVLTNKRYSEAAELDWPQEIKKLIMTNYSQEQRHFNYIAEVVSTPRHELR